MTHDIDYARYDHVRPIRWTGVALELLDQRVLPFTVEYLTCTSSDAVAAAIHALAVRGAPAIGIAAAWGVVLAARDIEAIEGGGAALKLEPALQRLNAARPTAVNLAWALARMRRVLQHAGTDWRQVLEREAQAIASEDLAANRHMGALGAGLIEAGSGVLTVSPTCWPLISPSPDRSKRSAGESFWCRGGVRIAHATYDGSRPWGAPTRLGG